MCVRRWSSIFQVLAIFCMGVESNLIHTYFVRHKWGDLISTMHNRPLKFASDTISMSYTKACCLSILPTYLRLSTLVLWTPLKSCLIIGISFTSKYINRQLQTRLHIVPVWFHIVAYILEYTSLPVPLGLYQSSWEIESNIWAIKWTVETENRGSEWGSSLCSQKKRYVSKTQPTALNAPTWHHTLAWCAVECSYQC